MRKGVIKFVNYNRDLLEDTQISEIKSRLADLKKAAGAKDKEKTAELSKELEKFCKKSLPKYRPLKGIAENTEVLFVAIVIALGLRAYYLQPFRIPTGSMQPTLNGIVGHQLEKDKWPSLPLRIIEMGTAGRSYVHAVSAQDDELLSISQSTRLMFSTRTVLHFKNQKDISLPGSTTAVLNGAGLFEALHEGILRDTQEQYSKLTVKDKYSATLSLKFFGLDFMVSKKHDQLTRDQKARLNEAIIGILAGNFNGVSNPKTKIRLIIFRLPVRTDQVLVSGHVDTGDMVFVDKFSYHFRKPKRGETFVFDTRGIKGIHDSAKGRNQAAGSHYIKRCVGVPGDKVQVNPKSGELLIDGKVAQDPGLKYAMELTYNRGENDGSHKGYVILPTGDFIQKPSDYIKLKGEEKGRLAEYAAFGDNTENSFDSRGWGPVREYNLVGPALFTLWPFKHKDHQHWGAIK